MLHVITSTLDPCKSFSFVPIDEILATLNSGTMCMTFIPARFYFFTNTQLKSAMTLNWAAATSYRPSLEIRRYLLGRYCVVHVV